MQTKYIIASLLMTTMAASTTRAGIVATTGQVVTATPNSLIYGSTTSFTSDVVAPGPNAVLFREQVNYEIPTFSSLNPIFAGDDYMPLDISSVGTNVLSPLNLRSGTSIDSYIINFAPVGGAGSAVGTVRFDREIIGLEISFGLLREDYFGDPSFNLKESSGLEIGGNPETADYLTLSGDRKTLSFSLNADGATDVFRIFTQPMSDAPEPATLGLFGLGIVALGASRRRWPYPDLKQVRLEGTFDQAARALFCMSR